MKKLFSLLLIALLGIAVYAQDDTREVKIPINKHYATYGNAYANDILTDNQDTLDIEFQVQISESIRKIALVSEFDTIAGSDSIVEISILGRASGDVSYSTLLAASNTAEITGTTIGSGRFTYDATAYTETIGAVTDTFNADSTTTVAARTVTPLDLDFKFITVRLIYKGDATGEGVILEKLKLKLITQ